MENWFDDLAKGLTAPGISRRKFIGGLAALFGGAVLGGALEPAEAKRPRPSDRPGANGAPAVGAGSRPGARPRPSTDVNLKWGPCTITRKGKRVERAFVSTTSAGGRTITLHQLHTSGPLQTQRNLRVEVDGKTQYLLIRRKAKGGAALAAPALEVRAG